VKTRLFYTNGNRDIVETTYDKPKPAKDQIEVKSIYTGVCRSDVDMYDGKFHLPSIYMQGHEGLGRVTKVGSELKNEIEVGDYVATRGEPAFADYYNVNKDSYVILNHWYNDGLPDPSYIIEPVACGVNLVAESVGLKRHQHHKTIDFMAFTNTKNSSPGWSSVEKEKIKNILILGTGFLATVVNAALKENCKTPDITVVGRANQHYWIGEKLRYLTDIDDLEDDERFDVIYDISPKARYVAPSVHHLADAGTLVVAAEKMPAVAYPINELLWKSARVLYPSPRSKNFQTVMHEAVAMVQYEQVDVSGLWTQEYDRDTEVKQAFEDGLNRKEGYSRGYIKWKQ